MRGSRPTPSIIALVSREDFVMREDIPLKVRTIGISDDYVEHGNVDVLRKEVGLDRESIVKKVIADDRRIEEEK